jgi:hypothetical protein
VSGEQAEQEPGGRARISTEERTVGPAEPRPSVHGHRRSLTQGREVGAELAQHPRGRTGIEGREGTANVAGAPGKGGKEEHSVGNALISRNPNIALNLHRSIP